MCISDVHCGHGTVLKPIVLPKLCVKSVIGKGRHNILCCWLDSETYAATIHPTQCLCPISVHLSSCHVGCSHKFSFRSTMKDAIGVHELTVSRTTSAEPGLLTMAVAGSRRTSTSLPSLCSRAFCILVFSGLLYPCFFKHDTVSHAADACINLRACCPIGLLHTY